MALAELLQVLEEEAARRVDEVRGGARAEADRIRRDGAAALDRRRADAVSAREVALRAAAARDVEAAGREATGRVLGARAAALDQVRSRALERLGCRAGDPALVPLLRRDLEAALGCLGEKPGTVEVHEAVLDALREMTPAGDGVRLRPGRTAGLVVRADDGSVVIDASFEARLDLAWPALAIELAPALEEPT